MKDAEQVFKKIFILILTILLLGGIMAILALAYTWSRRDPAPGQPIAFSHRIHVGEAGLPCTYCHAFVEKSRHAGIPAVSLCMECHKGVATDKPEIRKLTSHWEEKKPIVWRKVHSVPDFVRFTHKRHSKAGIDCSACHGVVAAMEKIRRVRSLEMGWCIGCHRAKGGPQDCLACHH